MLVAAALFAISIAVGAPIGLAALAGAAVLLPAWVVLVAAAGCTLVVRRRSALPSSSSATMTWFETLSESICRRSTGCSPLARLPAHMRSRSSPLLRRR